MSRIELLVLLVVSLTCASCAIPATPLQEIAPTINATLSESPTVLVAGDLLEIVFLKQEEYNQETMIRPDGRATFHRIGEIRCAGLSIEQLTRALRDAYRSNNYIVDPEPTVRIKTAAERYVYVYGEFKEPGQIVFPPEGLSLLQAFGGADGFLKETACLEQTVLARYLPKRQYMAVWEFDASQEEWEGPAAIILRPGDVIFVPNTPIDDVNIWVDQYIRRMIPIPMPTVPIY